MINIGIHSGNKELIEQIKRVVEPVLLVEPSDEDGLLALDGEQITRIVVALLEGGALVGLAKIIAENWHNIVSLKIDGNEYNGRLSGRAPSFDEAVAKLRGGCKAAEIKEEHKEEHID